MNMNAINSTPAAPSRKAQVPILGQGSFLRNPLEKNLENLLVARGATESVGLDWKL